MVEPFIVIDGTDGSGKKTQVDLLVERLKREGHPVAKFDFPQYPCWSSVFVQRYLNGEFGPASDVPAKIASIFYALDRYAASFDLRRLQSEGNVIVANRYAAANKGHQLGKINGEKERLDFLAWLNDLEYRVLGIPVPDLTLFLHMDAALGKRLADERDRQQGKEIDNHQQNLDHLRRAEEAYLFCLKHDPMESWRKIICFQDGAPLPIPTIHEEVYRTVSPLLGRS